MYWYVYMFEFKSVFLLVLAVAVGLIGLLMGTVFCKSGPRKWLCCIRTALIFIVMLILLVIFVDYTTDVGENTILMKIKDSELTGEVLTGDENRGLLLFKTAAFMRLKDEIEGNQDVQTADGKGIKLIVTAVVAVEDPNKVFYVWRDSEKRSGSYEEANTNILDLISKQYMEVINHATLEDLEKDRVSPKTFFGVNNSIKSVLKKNGLELLDMKVLLRLPDKVLGEIKSTIVIAETKGEDT